MNTEILQEIGLTQTEIDVYAYLLYNGPSQTGPIIKHTKHANSQIYRTLNSLIKQGLVTYIHTQKAKIFSAANIEYYIEEKQQALKQIQQEVNAIRQQQQKIPQAAIYEGIRGFKHAFKQLIDETPHKGIIRIIGFSKQQHQNELLRTFLKNINLRSHEKKQELRILLSEQDREELGKDREDEPNTKVRYIEETTIPSAIDILEQAVYTLVWDKEPIVFRIENAAVVNSYKNYFDTIWKQAEQ